MATDPKPSPDARGILQERMLPAVTLCRDVLGGTLAVRKKGETYLPRFEKEEERDYTQRKSGAVLFNAFRRTVKGLVGMIHRAPITLSDSLPAEIRADLENVDLAGRHLDVFARDMAEDGWVDGHAAILVDFQAIAPGQAPTLADERALGVRPYWVLIRKGQILRVRTTTIGGHLVLTRFAYHECVTEDDGEYGEKEVERVRDYRLVAGPEGGAPRVEYIVHTKRKNEKREEQWEAAPPAHMTIDEIPVATHYTARTGFMASEPPLLDLALENILHYQVRSDRQNVLHVASVPIPVFKGLREQEGETKVGVNAAILLNSDGDAFYLEPEGKALEHSATELKDIEQRMAFLGLSMLMSDSRSAETATSKEIDKSESDSALLAAVRDEEDAIEAAIALHAKWRGLELKKSGEERWASVNRDFVRHPLDPQMAQVLLSAVDSGKLSIDTLWDLFVRGDLLPTSFDPAKEKLLLESVAPPAPADELAALRAQVDALRRGEPAVEGEAA